MTLEEQKASNQGMAKPIPQDREERLQDSLPCDVVSFEHASFTYDGNSFVFRDLDLKIERGEFVCIIGENGCGKSTIAKHMNALLEPDGGRVCVLGMDTKDEGAIYDIRAACGMVFQNPDDQLVATLVEDDVAFGPENLGLETSEIRRRVDSSLKSVGLSAFAHRDVFSLSGGQKQRVAIAGILAFSPEIIIFDEASAMLDPKSRHELSRLLGHLHDDGFTILTITHFMEEAALADRIVVLGKKEGPSGKSAGVGVLMDGTPAEVFSHVDELRSMNLDIPFSIRICLALRERGVPVGICLDENVLEEELCRLLSKM